MFPDRLNSYTALEQRRNSKLLVYVTGDRQGMETQMAADALTMIAEHLDLLGTPDKITLLLHSRGGDIAAGRSIANLIRAYCKEFEVIVPVRALSSATLLCLGANNIIMTKQATLGPVDPSVNTPLNPQIVGAPMNARYPVSVEAVKGFVRLAKNEFGVKRSSNMAKVLTTVLSANNGVHPLVLGEVFRARKHIRMLAKDMLDRHFGKSIPKWFRKRRIINFLCAESGSHDFGIDRRHARKLGLPVEDAESPDADLNKIIMDIYKDIEKELELRNRFVPEILLSDKNSVDYECRRALIESVAGGTNVFVSKGVLLKQQVQQAFPMIQIPGMIPPSLVQIQDVRNSEEWRRENGHGD